MNPPEQDIAPPPIARTSGQSSDEMDNRSAHGYTDKIEDLKAEMVEPGHALTGNQGVKISDDQNSLKAGTRGPSLLEDFLLREKITHFDHERIPERVVHARGAAAHGYFESYGDISDITAASVFKPGKQTPVFLRFSTVAGSKGSPDTPRDVRGFAIKFYTDEGVWDMVGNNMPVFFIQDAIKFPDLIHAVKPEPNNEIPQAASAHDTFWDFASLTPEISHMLMWVMSDRALPRSYAMMEGFGIHTWRFVTAEGKSSFVKLHFKPAKGVKSLVWDEAQKIAGKDADFNRRDLFESIERGDFPEWEMGIQVVSEEEADAFEFDILDSTKLIPEEMVPVQPIGKLVLNRNPENYFAETEQVAFCLSHMVPGIDFTNDPLLQGRLFSYLDTQLRRIGPNFHELPINRSLTPVHNNQRDGFARTTINKGRVAYFPNGLGGGTPAQQPAAAGGFVSFPEPMAGIKQRVRSETFSDHFSQATMFFNSMADWEQDHIIDAISFELNQCEDEGVRNRAMNELLVNIDPALASGVSEKTGIAVNPTGGEGNLTPSAPNPAGPPSQKMAAFRSPALSMDKPGLDIKGRRIALLCGDGVDGDQLTAAKNLFKMHEAIAEVVAAKAGAITTSTGESEKVNRAAPNAASVIYDAVVVLGGASAAVLAEDGLAKGFVSEQFRHFKPIAALGDGAMLLTAANLPDVGADQGVFIGTDTAATLEAFVEGLKMHRFHHRPVKSVPC
jgi:catalase